MIDKEKQSIMSMFNLASLVGEVEPFYTGCDNIGTSGFNDSSNKWIKMSFELFYKTDLETVHNFLEKVLYKYHKDKRIVEEKINSCLVDL